MPSADALTAFRSVQQLAYRAAEDVAATLVEGVTEGHASAVLAASIFHFGKYSIAEAHEALRAAGLAARA